MPPLPSVPSVTPLDGGELSVQSVNECNLAQHHLLAFQTTVVDNCIGLAPIYGANVALTTLTLVSSTNALVIRFGQKNATNATIKQRQLLQDLILCNDAFTKYAFYMDKILFALFKGFKIRAASTISLLSPKASGVFHAPTLVDVFKGIPGNISQERLSKLFKDAEGKGTKLEDSVYQAWLARHAGASPSRLSGVISMDSFTQDESHLEMSAKLYCLAIQLRNLKPDVVMNDVDRKNFKVGKGHVDITSTRFQTRVTRHNTSQSLELKVTHADGRVSGMTARTKRVSGREVQIIPSQSIAGAVSIKSVKTFGREEPTNSEENRHRLLVAVLKGTATILMNPFVKAIFFPNQPVVWPSTPGRRVRRAVTSDPRISPNNSQAKAIEAIISIEDQRRVVLVHGPPGTGKTTVIAVSSYSIVTSDPTATVWLMAHSNVAVKNIAEKLVQSNFLDFKIIVSKEFHFDWHEHLYGKVEGHLIRTDSLPDNNLAAERLLLGCRVILSTVSNMLNGNMKHITLTTPVQTMIIDEASQIDIGDYLPVINRFQHTLQKLVFIGDDKQLAPYGREQIKDLDSIFEKRHLRPGAILLDKQYRMPHPIGSFISEHVYDGKLSTHHNLLSPKTCRFVNVQNSEELQKGHSWMNWREAAVVIAIAKQLVGRGLAFRIITPYDPQRWLLENELKRANLPHEDKCFNVDSFQGNEADYIIVSLVRSANKLGFLQEDRRVNVMLSRCKKGMVVVTNRRFVEDVAQDSLVGKLAKSLPGNPWIEGRKVLYGGHLVFDESP